MYSIKDGAVVLSMRYSMIPSLGRYVDAASNAFAQQAALGYLFLFVVVPFIDIGRHSSAYLACSLRTR